MRSAYLGNKIQEHERGISTYTPPASTFFALWIGDPLDGGTEVVAADYDRIEVDNDNTEWDVTANVTTNINAVTFTASPANDWAVSPNPVTHVAEYDALAGNMLNVTELSVPMVILSGGPPVEFPIGTLKFTEGVAS
jgi:hypothetical protein